jgi:hypothetical protein
VELDKLLPSGTKLRAAMALAVIADLAQMVVFPLFIEGAASPADDVLDLAMAGVLSYLLGWHWTLAVANVYRKTRQIEKAPDHPPAVIEGEPVRKK